MTSFVDRTATRSRHRLSGTRSWRGLDPGLWDLELAFGPVIDSLVPDLIHANDFRMLGPAVRAKLRANDRGRNVKVVWDVHEFLPGISPWNAHPRWHLAQLAHEREFAPYADAVVTVSEELADLLVAEHGLTTQPTVVMNCPVISTTVSENPGIREQAGLEPQTPLLVYSGSVSAKRGLEVVVAALPQLGDAVLALVSSDHRSAVVQDLIAQAEELGVRDRVRLLDYVPFDQVVANLTSADVGLIPIQHYPNHEIALITKFFEYVHAGLPIVVSDVRAMAHQVREHGIGEVFTAGDVDDFARAVRLVLKDPEAYRRALHRSELRAGWTWETQAEVLDKLYRTTLL